MLGPLHVETKNGVTDGFAVTSCFNVLGNPLKMYQEANIRPSEVHKTKNVLAPEYTRGLVTALVDAPGRQDPSLGTSANWKTR